MQFADLLETYSFEKYVLEICIATIEHGGATSKLDTYCFVSATEAWGVPRHPDKTAILPPGRNLVQEIKHFIAANETYLREPNSWLGTWIDPYTGNCYLDITTIYTCLGVAVREAIALSQQAQRRIIALYDFKHAQPLYLRDQLGNMA